MLVLLGLGGGKKKASYSIRIRAKPSGLPWHSLDQLYPNESGAAHSAPQHQDWGCTWEQPGLAWHSWHTPCMSLSPHKELFQGHHWEIKMLPGAHALLCCWFFPTLASPWIRIFGLLPAKFFQYISWECCYIFWDLWYRFGKNATGL